MTTAAPHAALAHRGGLGFLVERLYPDPTPLERLGGRVVVGQVVDGLYDRIETDEVLRVLFKHDLVEERARQKGFFVQWAGGAAD